MELSINRWLRAVFAWTIGGLIINGISRAIELHVSWTWNLCSRIATCTMTLLWMLIAVIRREPLSARSWAWLSKLESVATAHRASAHSRCVQIHSSERLLCPKVYYLDGMKSELCADRRYAGPRAFFRLMIKVASRFMLCYKSSLFDIQSDVVESSCMQMKSVEIYKNKLPGWIKSRSTKKKLQIVFLHF